MAAYSSFLAWKIPWIEKPDRLRSMGSQRAGLSTHMQYVSMCDIKRWVLGALLSRGRTLSDGKGGIRQQEKSIVVPPALLMGPYPQVSCVQHVFNPRE